MTYWGILQKVPGSQLRLTKIDDEIHEHLKRDFPDFDPAQTIDEDKMKSKEGKERWRNFMNQYEKVVKDYNFGTIIRTNPRFEYDQHTTIFGMVFFFFPVFASWSWSWGCGIHCLVVNCFRVGCQC